MEEAYLDNTEHPIDSDIFSMWLNSYSEKDSDEYKICDLAKRFNTSIEIVVKSVKSELKTDYLKTLSKEQLLGMLSTLNLHKESLGNKVQIEILKTVLNELPKENL